jgi:phage terminase Nu1 subunit (DNA packaging protein)
MADFSQKTYSLVQTAAILGVHRNTLSKWIDQGAPVQSKADRSRGVEWEISIPAVIEWRITKAVEEAVSGYADESGKITREEADRRRAVAQAIVAEVEADQVLGQVVARSDAEADMAAFCMVLKTGLANAAAKIAARGAVMTNPPEIQEFCEAELNRAFDAAQGELVARWVNGTDDSAAYRGEDQSPQEG